MIIRDLLLQHGAQRVLNEINNLCATDLELIDKDQYAYWHGLWTKQELSPLAVGVSIIDCGNIDEYGKNFTIVQSRKYPRYYCKIESYENSYGELQYTRWSIVTPIEKTITVFQ